MEFIYESPSTENKKFVNNEHACNPFTDVITNKNVGIQNFNTWRFGDKITV